MKYEGTKKSGADKDVDVFMFTMGSLEARLVRDLLQSFINKNKNIFEVSPAINRARNIVKSINEHVPLAMPKYQHSEKELQARMKKV